MKLQVPFIQLPFLTDVEKLAAEISVFDESAWRPHPLGYAGNSALAMIAVDGNTDSDDFAGPMQPTKYLDQCPYIRQIMGELGAVWGRARLMRLSGQSEVEPHVDINYYWHERVRVHIPIFTKPSVRFICGDAEINMAAGECWIFDTWRLHRVVNANDDERIHLVLDTVGSETFWNFVNGGRAPGRPAPANWAPRKIVPDSSANPSLRFESVNLPTVMTPWEMKEHIGFLLSEVAPHPNLPVVQQAATRMISRWQAFWACYGESADGWSDYRAALDTFEAELRQSAMPIKLRNSSSFFAAMMGLVVRMALSDKPTSIRDQAMESLQTPSPALASAAAR
jgi:hypothetical protein